MYVLSNSHTLYVCIVTLCSLSSLSRRGRETNRLAAHIERLRFARIGNKVVQQYHRIRSEFTGLFVHLRLSIVHGFAFFGNQLVPRDIDSNEPQGVVRPFRASTIEECD